MTPLQSQALSFIRANHAELGEWPTVRSLATGIRVSEYEAGCIAWELLELGVINTGPVTIHDRLVEVRPA